MAIKKIKLPDNTTEDINDPRLPAVTATDNGKLLGVDGGIWSKVNAPSYTLDEVADGSTRKLANYLPLTGGTLTNSTGYILTINRTGSTAPTLIAFQQAGTLKGFLGIGTDGAPTYLNSSATSYNIYHSGNSNSTSVNWSANTLTANYAHLGNNRSVTNLELFGSTGSAIGFYNDGTRVALLYSGGDAPFRRYNGDWSAGYTIYDSGNSNKSDVAWACSTLTASGNITASGTITQGSDSRIKDNQKDISSENAFFVIENLKPKTWVWNEKSNEKLNGKKAAGLVAQEVKEILPDAVTISENGGIKDFHSLNYNTIQGYEIAAIKGLIEEVKSLKAEIEELKKQIK